MLRQGRVTLEELTGVALDAASQAGSLALSGFRKSMRVSEKGESDLVTEFDLASERLLRQLLAERTPSIPVFGEEEGGSRTAERVWYCDPIDGTNNYAHGHPFWAVSVGLMAGTEPVAGAVVAPALGITWTGYRGGPALRNGEPCHVSPTRELGRALVATGFPRDLSRSPDDNFGSFVHVKRNVQGVRRCGSAAIDVCLVADGTYDAFWERRLSTWDLAAGVAIALSAGGTLSHLDGGPAVLDGGHVLLDNGFVHDDMLRLLRESVAIWPAAET
ncbi:MAG: inositol monophosphatase [Myxococcales bacterium]|nr:inositol monophosphatase [Myxococcales bacterium]MCB9580073.1 inositol monophosphatase [Polyangiaceae bacterium]